MRIQLLAAALAGAVLTACAVIVFQDVSEGGSTATEASSLPTACENLVQAASAMAEDGSSAASHGPSVFSSGAGESPAETLAALVDSCDEELALHR